jgi:SAM-dependent methyltransferase
MIEHVTTAEAQLRECPACHAAWACSEELDTVPDCADVMLTVLPAALQRRLRYGRCGGCATIVAVDERRRPGLLARAYEALPEQYWSELANARRFSSQLERHLAGHARGWELWDVGCGAGEMLAHLRQPWRKHGIEPGRRAVETARSRQLDVRLGTAASLGLADLADVVTAIDVVEHLLDPATELQAIRRMLRPGGIVALFTGAADDLVPRLAGPAWYYLRCAGHVTVFSRSGLRSLLENVGFEPIRTYRIEHASAVSAVDWARRYLGNIARRALGRGQAATHFFRDHQLVIARRSA